MTKSFFFHALVNFEMSSFRLARKKNLIFVLDISENMNTK